MLKLTANNKSEGHKLTRQIEPNSYNWVKVANEALDFSLQATYIAVKWISVITDLRLDAGTAGTAG